MTAARPAIQLRRAVKALPGQEAVLVAAVQRIFALRQERCDDACPGWFIGERGPERCDQCAQMNGYPEELSDNMLYLLPEVHQKMNELERSQDPAPPDEE